MTRLLYHGRAALFMAIALACGMGLSAGTAHSSANPPADGEPEAVAYNFMIALIENDGPAVKRLMLPASGWEILVTGRRAPKDVMAHWKQHIHPKNMRRLKVGDIAKFPGMKPATTTDEQITSNAVIVRVGDFPECLTVVRTAEGWKVDAGPTIRQRESVAKDEADRRAASEAADKAVVHLDAKAYRNEEHHFFIRFPKTFQPIAWDDKRVATLYRDETGANFNVICPELPKPLTLEKLFELSKPSLAQGGLKNFRELATGLIYCDDGACKWIMYAHGREGERVKAMCYIYVDGQRAAVITATAPEAAFDRYRPLFDAAVRTFQFEFAN